MRRILNTDRISLQFFHMSLVSVQVCVKAHHIKLTTKSNFLMLTFIFMFNPNVFPHHLSATCSSLKINTGKFS